MRYVADAVLDNGLDYLKDNVTLLVLTAGGSTVYADVVANNGTGSGVKILSVVVDASDITLTDGAVDGRKAVMAEQLAITPTANGDGDHVAWVDTANSAVLAVLPLAATLTGLTTSGAPVDLQTHFIAARDATAAT